jgi:hypothetical protein
MNHFVNVLAAAGMAVSLTACNTSEQTAATIDDIQKAAMTACGFLPTANTILAIFNSNPAVTTASAVATAICAAVEKQGGDGAWVLDVNGTKIPIQGRFIR